MYNISDSPRLFDEIKWGEIETTTEIVFHGKFYESSGFPKLKQGIAVRYGKYKDNYYIAIDRHKSFVKVVVSILENNNDYIITCTINNADNKKFYAGHIVYADITKQEDDLGIVIIKLDKNI